MSVTGGCLCGGVRYEARGEVRAPIACHCSQCARTSGHYAAMACCRVDDLSVAPSETLTWYRSSENVERGFCSRCGGNLFWKADASEEIYLTAGTLDRPTGMKLIEHIYVGSKSDYYELADGLPQKQEW